MGLPVAFVVHPRRWHGPCDGCAEIPIQSSAADRTRSVRTTNYRSHPHPTVSDLRFSLRLLIKDRAFTLVAGAVLAIGIAAVATQWSVISATLYRGLPFSDPDQLYQIQRQVPDNARIDNGVPAPDYEEWRAEQKSFEDLAGFLNGSTVNVTVGNEAKRDRKSVV